MKQDYIKCHLCTNSDRIFHKSGIQSHFKCVHKQSWALYQQSLFDKKCKICNTKLLRENQTFCSHKCMSIYAATCVKKHNNKYSVDTTKKQFEKIDAETKLKMIKAYVDDDQISIKKIEESFGIRASFISLILKEQKIQIRKTFNKKSKEERANLLCR